MSLNTFPSIMAPSYDFDESYMKRKVTSQFENGIEFSRNTATIGKRKFNLSWPNMPEADYQTLEAFFISQGAEPFNWTHPVTSTTHPVRFPLGELQSKPVPINRRSVRIELHEVPNAS